MTHPTKLAEAYDYCLKLAHSHYENFPVASFLLPAHLREPISVIYAFARTADDIADEGDAPLQERLDALAEYEQQLTLIEQQCYQGSSAIFIALNDVIKHHTLPIILLQDLLSAFRQDLTKNRYSDDKELEDYCRRSANPIGRLFLHLIGIPSSSDLDASDMICTALQRINFYQDIQQDLKVNDRIYLPLENIHEFGLTEASLYSPDSRELTFTLREKYRGTAALLKKGVPLGTRYYGRPGWEIRLITLAGLTTLLKLAQQDDANLYSRPRLSKVTLLGLSCCALVPSIYNISCKWQLHRFAKINDTITITPI